MARVTTVVVLSLILDLFAFTIPLPLFPRIIEWYRLREISNPNGFLSRTLHLVSYLRALFYKNPAHPARWDVVLLGGLMGSVFSSLQWLVSPRIGRLSDKYGRKSVLLWTLVGNILSAVVWIQSTSFASYMLSRVIGGLSEGNVQLANAIISDVTPISQRSRALSSVGIAFAICFCIGPPIGAYFASQTVPSSLNAWGIELNIYAVPAILTLILLLIETVYLIIALPETLYMRPSPETHSEKKGDKSGHAGSAVIQDSSVRLHRLGAVQRVHFLFLVVFSGVEFTLTFLTFDLLDWSNKRNGALIGAIGIVSGLLQRGLIRNAMPKIGEERVALRGVASCATAFALLALVPRYVVDHRDIAVSLLYLAAFFMAVTSASVVTSLTAYTSLQCDQDFEDVLKPGELAVGKVMGDFRSSGQAGRAIGPLIACASYWTFGPSTTYAAGAAAMLLVLTQVKKSLPPMNASRKQE